MLASITVHEYCNDNRYCERDLNPFVRCTPISIPMSRDWLICFLLLVWHAWLAWTAWSVRLSWNAWSLWLAWAAWRVWTHGSVWSVWLAWSAWSAFVVRGDKHANTGAANVLAMEDARHLLSTVMKQTAKDSLPIFTPGATENGTGHRSPHSILALQGAKMRKIRKVSFIRAR